MVYKSLSKNKANHIGGVHTGQLGIRDRACDMGAWFSIFSKSGGVVTYLWRCAGHLFMAAIVIPPTGVLGSKLINVGHPPHLEPENS
jgi:hypothetical protein